MLEHGGRLRLAAAQWGIPLAQWLDLSTGIAPWPYPVSVAPGLWQRLPEEDDGLEAAAARYYGHAAPLPVPGSQVAIQWLPRLLRPGRVVLPTPSYGEYAPAWREAGHAVTEVAMAHLAQAAADADVVMLGNPNNPTGERLATAALHDLARRLEQRGGWLVIDEAFGDAEPDGALAALAGTTLPRLVVLRSLGKFFGLAGARVGFVCAAAALQAQLAKAIGPWAVSNPSRHVAAQALADDPWQAQQRQRLRRAGEELRTLLARHDLASSGSDLFRYVVTADATRWHSHLARHGILVRLFSEPSALRFGLPGEEKDWTRLTAALENYPR